MLEHIPRPISGVRVRHYKGGEYTILTLARHTETWEPLVIYRDDENRIYARPASMFGEYLPDKKCYRFEPIGREAQPFDLFVHKPPRENTVSKEGDKHIIH